MIRKVLQELSNALGYQVPECQSPDLYFQLMALQVGSLSNPEAKEQLAVIDKIRLLCEVCELILERKVKVIDNFLDVLTEKQSLGATDEDQSTTACTNPEGKCDRTKCARPNQNHDGCR